MLGPSAWRSIVGQVKMNKGIRVTGVVLYLCGCRFPVDNRRSPDVGKSESLERTPGYEMRKDQHTTFSDHNLVTQKQHYTFTDSQQRLLCGNLDYVFVLFICVRSRRVIESIYQGRTCLDPWYEKNRGEGECSET